jgi:hypothetical protein
MTAPGPAERVCCGACGRALAACEWCGTADVLRGPGGERWPVTRRPGRAGAWHDPCYDEEQAVLGRVAGAARRFRGEDTATPP